MDLKVDTKLFSVENINIKIKKYIESLYLAQIVKARLKWVKTGVQECNLRMERIIASSECLPKCRELMIQMSE